ncbi:hypothetical protein K438DRAFT_1746897 [Mycena galopus ATCC 62051]|nr:hypothetical protein K438DRAFT_1746897 [Mycena galopus ATCC 62051]
MESSQENSQFFRGDSQLGMNEPYSKPPGNSIANWFLTTQKKYHDPTLLFDLHAITSTKLLTFMAWGPKPLDPKVKLEWQQISRCEYEEHNKEEWCEKARLQMQV